jgi:hypothetical protein
VGVLLVMIGSFGGFRVASLMAQPSHATPLVQRVRGWCVAHPHLVLWVRLRLRVRWRVGFLLLLVRLLRIGGYSLPLVLLPDLRLPARWCCPLVRYSVTHCPLVPAMVIGSVRSSSLCQPEPHAPHRYQPWFQRSGVGAADA